ncbi:MAG TPA: GIDE domain-containing protein [Sandaracinaceae bacterium LLY-WYZ-13_1]|nr:GIDE domain-containing protein [Sandaracinaceae bacterium LLY-WYZ-13_1]
MGAIAAILIAGGIVALIVGAYLKLKGGRIEKTPFAKTGEASTNPAVASPKGLVSVQGRVDCPQPLVSPATQTPCLYYQLEVVGSWKEGDAKKSKSYVDEKVAAPFQLDDGSGGIPVDASAGGDVDLQKTFDETKKEGFFADLKGAVGKGEPIMFGNYAFANPTLSKANEFRCIERLVPLPEQAFALGKLEEGVITSSGLLGLMLSPKTREEMLGSAARSSKMAFIGGAAAAGVGLVVGVVSALVGG